MIDVEDILLELISQGKTYLRHIKDTEYDKLLSSVVKVDTEANRKFKYNNLIKKWKKNNADSFTSLKKPKQKSKPEKQKKTKNIVQETFSQYETTELINEIKINTLTAKEQLIEAKRQIIEPDITEERKQSLKDKIQMLEEVVKTEYIMEKEKKINNEIKYQMLLNVLSIDNNKKQDISRFNALISATDKKILFIDQLINTAQTADIQIKAVQAFKDLQNQKIKLEELKIKARDKGLDILNSVADATTKLNMHNVNLILKDNHLEEQQSDINNIVNVLGEDLGGKLQEALSNYNAQIITDCQAK